MHTTPPMLRPIASAGLATVLCLALVSGDSALAQPTAPIDLGGGQIQLRVELPDGDGGFVQSNEEDIREHFNRANCLCEDVEFGVEFRLVDAPAALDTEPVDVWFGTTCDTADVTIRDANCTLEHTFSDVEELRTPDTVGFSVAALAGTCEPNNRERNVYALIDENDDGIDTTQGDYVGGPLGILIDTEPPPEPRNIRVSGAEQAIQVNWQLPTGRADDIEYFQVLCARADGTESDDDAFPRENPRYITARDCGIEDNSVCPTPVSIDPDNVGPDAGSAVAFGGGDAGPLGPDAGTEPMCSDLPGDLEILGTDHVCGEVSGTSTSVRIDGLENDVSYRIVLVAVDPSRNPLALDLGEHTPRPVTDFWEDYNEQGGRAQGGCSAGGTGGALLALLAGLGLVVMVWRRRLPASAALCLLIVLSASSASAQPWWEEIDEPITDAGPAPIHWGLEFKFGPYVPNVDSEFNLSEGEVGPFERMFGDGPFLLSAITLDFYPLHPLGQLGVYGSLGYMSKSAGAYEVDGNGEVVVDEDGDPIRSEGDDNTFRLFPMSVGAVYRFTDLDDRFRIPVVPFARLGLSYYFWRVAAPGGEIAEAPTMDCANPQTDDCTGNRASGGSLGWQGSVGLAIRAERVDPDAEIALRTELGIEHAGLVLELAYAKVDGFGSNEKLAVGDLTWFAGINFEF